MFTSMNPGNIEGDGAQELSIADQCESILDSKPEGLDDGAVNL